MDKVFTVVNDEVLVSTIKAAKRNIVYVAPGISESVAVELGRRFAELSKLSITIILDVDSEVYRMGYGDPDGLKLIKQLSDQYSFELRHQPGIRIGVLISDELTLIYSPTPQLIEAGSKQPDKQGEIALCKKN
jgi:hypothetical protein